MNLPKAGYFALNRIALDYGTYRRFLGLEPNFFLRKRLQKLITGMMGRKV